MGQQSFFLDNVKSTAPEYEVGTGTIETNKLKVLGSGTAFKTQLRAGAFIVNFTTNEIIRVVEVISDTVAVLEKQFSSEIAAASAMNYIPAYKGNCREIACIIPVYQEDNSTENAWSTNVNGAKLAPGVGKNFTKTNRDRSSQMDMVYPIIVDATGTQVSVDITY